jgi:hypothetical protein
MAFFSVAILVKQKQKNEDGTEGKEKLFLRATYITADSPQIAEEQARNEALAHSPETKDFYGHVAVAKEIPESRIREEALYWFKFDK